VIDPPERLAEVIESLVYGGLARYVDEIDKKKDPDPNPKSHEDPNILPDVPTRARGRRRSGPSDGG
jgi:hypothetical protein